MRFNSNRLADTNAIYFTKSYRIFPIFTLAKVDRTERLTLSESLKLRK